MAYDFKKGTRHEPGPRMKGGLLHKQSVCSMLSIIFLINGEGNSVKMKFILCSAVLMVLVTTPAFASVGTDQLGDGAVTAAKIADGAVTTNKVADGAVTDAKISGQISASKVSSAGLNADTVDGLHSAELAPIVHTHTAADIISGAIGPDKIANYANIKILHKGPVDGVNTFNSLVAAVNAAGAGASAAQRAVVIVMPGIYDVSTDYMVTPYVDIIGQDRTGTVVRGGLALWHDSDVRNLTFDNAGLQYYALYVGASGDNIAIRDCDIRVSGPGNRGIVIGKNSATWSQMDVEVSNVNIHAQDSSGLTIGEPTAGDNIILHGINIDINNGIGLDIVSTLNSPANFKDVKIKGIGIGVMANSAIVNLTNADIEVTSNSPNGTGAAGLQIVNRGRVTCRSCRIVQTSSENNGYAMQSLYGGYGEDVGHTFVIDNSEIVGAIRQVSTGVTTFGSSKISSTIEPGGTVKFVNSYDGNYDPIPNGIR